MVDNLTGKTLGKIDDVVKRTKNHPEYSKLVRKTLTNCVRGEADNHSILMEMNGDVCHSKAEKIRNKSLKNLRNARHFLESNKISLNTFLSLGNLIEPVENPHTGFRHKDVSFGGFHAPPIGQLYESMDSLVYTLNNNKEYHPVTLAIAAHIGIIEIHPYNDGNGRVSRLVQNHLLEKNGYPSAVIPINESSLYKLVLGTTLKDRYNHDSAISNPSIAEKAFYEFVGEKVLRSVEKIEKILKNNRTYQINIDCMRNNGLSLTVLRSLRCSLNRLTSEGIKTSYKKNCGRKNKNPCFIIKGDVGKENIESTINKISKKYNFKYCVDVIT